MLIAPAQLATATDDAVWKTAAPLTRLQLLALALTSTDLEDNGVSPVLTFGLSLGQSVLT
jgi:hypothetical protein